MRRQKSSKMRKSGSRLRKCSMNCIFKSKAKDKKRSETAEFAMGVAKKIRRRGMSYGNTGGDFRYSLYAVSVKE